MKQIARMDEHLRLQGLIPQEAEGHRNGLGMVGMIVVEGEWKVSPLNVEPVVQGKELGSLRIV